MQKKATTLVELIVAMTIAIILMGAIGIFVSFGMQNLFLQQSSLDNMQDFSDFSNDLRKSLSYRENNSGAIELVSSGVVFKRNKEYNNGGFSYIGTSLEDGFFCDDSESEDTKTKHIFIKNFIPYFENGENSINETLIGKLIDGTDTYISYQKEHKITKNGKIIVGKGVFGDKFNPSDFGTGIYLNSPTGMALDNEGNLYFSDTLNNRILYLSGSRVYKLLDENSLLKEPTGLYFNNSEKALYISNSGKGEILKLSSKKENLSNFSLDLSFTPKEKISNVGKIKLEFFNGNEKLNLTGSLDSSNIINFPENLSDDYLTGTSEINYYFNNFGKIEKTEPCISPGNETIGPYIENNIIKKKEKSCTNTGTPPTLSGSIKTYSTSKRVDFSDATNYNIKIENLNFKNPENINGNIYLKLTFYKFVPNNREEIKTENIYFKTIGDDKIYSLEDNILEKYKENLAYPNGIWGNGNNDFNEFKNYNTYDYKLDKKNDIILKTPINKLEISKDSDLLNFILKYYRNYNCFNLGENKEKIKTFLLKKNLK